MNYVWLAVLVSLIPFIAVWIAVFLPLKFSKIFISAIQATASGFLLGSIILDLMPRVLQNGVQFSYIISFIIGFALMYIMQLKESGKGCCPEKNAKNSLKSFLTSFAMEFFVTAVLIGIAVSASLTLLLIIATSFGLCNFVCGLSISSRLTALETPKEKRFGITLLLTTIFPIGALLSALLASHVPIEWVNDLLTFAVATLLYLVQAELLPEALEGSKKTAIALLFSSITFIFILLHIL